MQYRQLPLRNPHLLIALVVSAITLTGSPNPRSVAQSLHGSIAPDDDRASAVSQSKSPQNANDKTDRTDTEKRQSSPKAEAKDQVVYSPRYLTRARLLGAEFREPDRMSADEARTRSEAIDLATAFVSRECDNFRDRGFRSDARWVSDPGIWAVAFTRPALDDELEVTEYMPFAVKVERNGKCSFIIWGHIRPVDDNGLYKAGSEHIKLIESVMHRWDPRFPGNGGPVDPCHILSDFVPDKTKPLSARQAFALINRYKGYDFYTKPPNVTEVYRLEPVGYWFFLFRYQTKDGPESRLCDTMFDRYGKSIHHFGQVLQLERDDSGELFVKINYMKFKATGPFAQPPPENRTGPTDEKAKKSNE
jgi:hypothetical protein